MQTLRKPKPKGRPFEEVTEWHGHTAVRLLGIKTLTAPVVADYCALGWRIAPGESHYKEHLGIAKTSVLLYRPYPKTADTGQIYYDPSDPNSDPFDP